VRTRRLLVPALIAIVAIAYATASSAGSSSWIVERYYTDETWHAFADIGAKNGGPDDVYAAQQSLKTTDGRNVGVVNGYGVNLHPPYVFFHWTATLAPGTLTLESAVNLKNKVAPYPIAGGTGRYAGARGTVTLTDAGNKGALVTVRYTR
jgi:Allene oxide cyclase barrel like domain